MLAVRRMVYARPAAAGVEVVEHHWSGQTPQEVRPFNDLLALDVELHVPAEIRHALRQRLDHLDLHDGVAGSVRLKRMPRTPAS